MKENNIFIKAEQKYIRISPRKVRLVANAVKKLSPQDAIEQLGFINKSSALHLKKTIKQAVSNATNNLKLAAEDLKFEKIVILKGPIYKRWRPVARGRAHSILKRTCHIRVVLKTKKPKLEPKAAVKKPKVKKVKKGAKGGTKS